MAEFQPGSTFAGYVIEGLAGRGGMGVVYRASQARPRRTVAVKVIAPEYARDDSFRERFERESELAALIEHPGVIPVYDVGEEDGLLYIAMRFVEGTDLRDLLAGGPLPPERAVDLVDQVAGALDAAHARGLVHRDVKPANILISQAGDREHVYLTDFGLTRQTTDSAGMTATGVFVGTLDYAAPEQVHGERVDARTDVYALGCVLYHALSGQVPFPRPTDMAKMFAQVNDPVPPLPPIAGGEEVRAALDEVVQRAAAKDPVERFPSAGDAGRGARAAVEGARLSGSERVVATGAAAPAEAEDATQVRAPAGTAAEPETRIRDRSAGAAAPPRRRPRMRVAATAGALVAAGGLAAVLALSGGGDGDAGGGGARQIQLAGDATVRQIGAWAPDSSPTVAEAAAALGAPDRAIKRRGTNCDFQWEELGMIVHGTTFGDVARDPCEVANATARSAEVDGSGWRTAEDLRVGDPLEQLRRIYPNAVPFSVVKEDESPPPEADEDFAIGIISSASGQLIQLAARLERGRVRAFAMALGGSGL